MFVKAANIPENAVVTVELFNGVHGPATLDSDLNAVLRITDKDTQKIILTVVDDGVSETKIYSLKGLTLSAS